MDENVKSHTGIFIDIFPMDDISDVDHPAIQKNVKNEDTHNDSLRKLRISVWHQRNYEDFGSGYGVIGDYQTETDEETVHAGRKWERANKEHDLCQQLRIQKAVPQ